MVECSQQYRISLVALGLFILNSCSCTHQPALTVDQMVRRGGVLRQDLPDGRVKYTITDVAFRFDGDPESSPEIPAFEPALPKTAEVRYDTANGLIHVTGRLSLADIKKAVVRNNWVGLGGGAPFWDELVLQGQKSEDFDPSLYSCVFSRKYEGERMRLFSNVENGGSGRLVIGCSGSSDKPADPIQYYQLEYANGACRIATLSAIQSFKPNEDRKWYRPYDRTACYLNERKPEKTPPASSYTLGLRVQGKSAARAVFTSHSYSCHNHLRIALRVYGSSSGKHVWRHVGDIACEILPIAHDFDNDGTDEIVVLQIDHRVNARVMVFKRKEAEKSPG
jgi:hypothetical protein